MIQRFWSEILEHLEMVERRLGISTAWLGRPVLVTARTLRKRAVVVFSIFLASGVVSPSQMAVLDAANLQTNKLLAELRKQEDHIRDLWKEGKDNARFLTDLLQVYRTIKLAKSQYEAIANFNLMSNVNVVDILPIVPLSNGFMYGDQDNTPPQTYTYIDENGNQRRGTAEKSLALRFTYKQGGFASTFQDWSKFKPNLKIDLSQIANQLANIDFDAAEMTQFVDATGHPLAEAYRALGPAERMGKITSFYNGMLATVQNWQYTIQQERDAKAAMNQDAMAVFASFETSTDLLRRQMQQEEERQRTERKLEYDSLGLEPPATDTSAEFWANKRKIFERGTSRRRAFLDGMVADRKLRLDQMFKAFKTLKAAHSGTQTAMESLRVIESAQAEQSAAEQTFQKSRQQLLKDYALEFKGGNFEDTASLQMNDQAWKQYLAHKESRDTAVNHARSAMDGALARIKGLEEIENSGKAFDDLQDDLGKNLLTRYIDGDGIGLSSSLRRIHDIKAQMGRELAEIRADETRDAQAISQGAIDKLDAVVDKYMSTYVFNIGKNGNSRISGGGLPAYIVTKTIETYAKAIKRAFGASNVADIMMPDDADARAKADADYQAFLKSMFTIRG